MGLIKDNLCWKCKKELGTYMHAFWERPMAFPLWRNVLKYMGERLERELPRSPWGQDFGAAVKQILIQNINKWLNDLFSIDSKMLERTSNSYIENVEDDK